MRSARFHLEATQAYAGVALHRLLFSIPSWLLYIAALVTCVHFSLKYANFPLLGVTVIIAAFVLFALYCFIVTHLWHDRNVQTVSDNLAHLLSADMVRMLAQEEEVTAGSLLHAAVATRRGAAFLQLLGVEGSAFLQDFEYDAHKEEGIVVFLERADKLREEEGELRIDGNIVLFLFLAEGGEEATAFLNEQDLSLQDVKHVLQWEQFHEVWDRAVHSWRPERLIQHVGTIGHGWVQGYTEQLDAYCTDLGKGLSEHLTSKIVIHTQKIEQVLQVLSRSADQNVLLLGRPGVGKQALVSNVAKAIRRHEDAHTLPYTRVLFLHSELLVSSAEHPDAVLLQALNRAMKAGRFILVVDNLSVLVQCRKGDVLAVLAKFLRSPKISLLAVADPQAYHVLRSKDPALGELFETVTVDDATRDETLFVLMEHAFHVWERARLRLSYKTLMAVLNLADRYVGSVGFPGKAVVVLDDAALAAQRRGGRIITEEDVRTAVSVKAHMDVHEISEDERERLLQLEEGIRTRIIGQDEAIEALVSALKRARLDLTERDRPIGTFLFLGPTGVGKTQTAKELACAYFGDREALIRLDMNEFSTADSVKMLVGAPDVSEELAEGELARRVQDRPFSLILLDEIEKAHPAVINVFLQVLDEGQLTDSTGIRTDFRNTIIIATSNAGALFIRDFLRAHGGEKRTDFKKALIDSIIKEKTFTPEFINRFDEVVLYRPLSLESAKRVSLLMLDEIVGDLKEKRGIAVQLEEGVVGAIVERGYSREFGAREMRRTIVDLVENYIADYMLKNDVKRGDTIRIRKGDIQADA